MSMLDRLRRWLGWSAPAGTPGAQTDVGRMPAPQPRPPSALADGMLLIDVRTEREFRGGALEGAINLPLAHLEHRIREVAADTAMPLVLYCASGARSGRACMLLRRLGYANVSNAGGLFAAAAVLKLELR